MKQTAWRAFATARKAYKASVEELRRVLPDLQRIQQALVDSRSGPAYVVETPIVYNEALDDVGPKDEIKLILVADNPGRREQAAENRRYLVGPSGKIAERFFYSNPGLGIDFRKNAIILNKTPIHTPRTAELKELYRLGGSSVEEAAVESQRIMARLLADFHRALTPAPVWIIGYSEMKRGGIFGIYTETVQELYDPRKRQNEETAARRRDLRNELFLYRHFSMNQFTIDLRQQVREGESPEDALRRIGASYRKRILNF
ncbi:MAG: hypothetical protein LBJ24_07530 [Treponema sp.]|jgi:hypothetical protein|nr:hypothetical protein [Treponema sp.]